MKKIISILLILIIFLAVNNVQAGNYFEDYTNVRSAFNNKLIWISVVLIVYWIILIFKYERDKKYDIASNDDEMFKKYNPLVAGCIQGSRNVLARDIIAVILDLVNKKYLSLDIVPINSNNEDYKYILKINPKSNYQLDEIEKYIVDWIFFKSKIYNKETEGMDLLERLKELPTESVASKKFYELNNITKKQLTKLGANKVKIPKMLQILNGYIFFLSIILAIYNIIGPLDANEINYIQKIFNNKLIKIMFPFLLIFIVIVGIKLFLLIKKIIMKAIQKKYGQSIVHTSFSIILIFITIILATLIFANNKYLLVGEVLIGVASLILFTDNLMLKNDPIMAEDYSRLNALKRKIEDYSMLEDKKIQQIVLWERYLTYAISFGISNKITDRIKIILNEEWMLKVLENKILFSYINEDYIDFSKM